MCYTPVVSLTTALIEWLLAALLLLLYRRSRIADFGAAVMILLGLYQFSEFMLCTTGNAELWGTIAFLSYTFLPALGVHTASIFVRKHFAPALIYAPPVVFSLIALTKTPFVTYGTCDTFFVTMLTYFSQQLPWVLYAAYYFGFICIAFALFTKGYCVEHGNRKKACAALLTAILLMFIPTFILIGIFPALRIRFPSVLCHFALLTAAAFFIAVYYDAKNRPKHL